jgi:hypothetical protein
MQQQVKLSAKWYPTANDRMVSEGEWTPRQAVFFRFPIWGLLLVFLTAFFVSGCSPRKVSKTKIVKPTNQGDAQNEEPPKSLDREAILAALRERQTTDLRTLKANASCVIEDLNTEERERVTSTFIAEPPHALLFRASKPGTIGEVFRLLLSRSGAFANLSIQAARSKRDRGNHHV